MSHGVFAASCGHARATSGLCLCTVTAGSRVTTARTQSCKQRFCRSRVLARRGAGQSPARQILRIFSPPLSVGTRFEPGHAPAPLVFTKAEGRNRLQCQVRGKRTLIREVWHQKAKAWRPSDPAERADFAPLSSRKRWAARRQHRPVTILIGVQSRGARQRSRHLRPHHARVTDVDFRDSDRCAQHAQ